MTSIFNINSDSVLSVLAGQGVDISEWKTYTPVVTTSGSASVTTTSLTGRYKQDGLATTVQISHSFDSDGAGGELEYSLPTLAPSDNSVTISTARYFNGSARSYPACDVHPNSPNKLVVNGDVANGTGQFLNAYIEYPNN